MQIILNGFMGTGKTTIGKILAHRLDCQFFDLDALIEQDQKASIAEIFSIQGEKGFRKLETKKLSSILEQDGVIALGGGALTNPENLELVLSGDNLLVGLCCSAEEILKRVYQDKAVRPLLNSETEEPLQKVNALLKQREIVYQNFDIQIDTTEVTPDRAALMIEEFAVLRMTRVQFPGGSYPIFIGRDVLSSLGRFILSRKNTKKVAIVTNTIVADLYLEPVLKSLKAAAIEHSTIIIPDGEQGKNLDTVSAIYSQLVELNADRSSILLALGGGITGDICGFAAATYMRGISYIQVPTTLVSMVDSSIGGKTGVNITQGKNLVGSFKQPEMVVMDLNTLKSLPEEEILNGFGELIKHGFIADRNIVKHIEDLQCTIPEIIDQETFPNILFQSLQVKRYIVQKDPFEKNERMLLNFGHTLGHAIEKGSAHKIPHGKAVIIGMWFAIMLSRELEYLSEDEFQMIDKIYTRLNLPRSLDGFSIRTLKSFIKMDKKKKDDNLRWILLHQIGEGFITSSLSLDRLDDVLSKLGAEI
ncbi:MAG: 3-dehydroquinate synthase [Anaerolineaceae bacterium]|nr:3-dehydroquinate synthase [Anaerolineaceae bacterium]